MKRILIGGILGICLSCIALTANATVVFNLGGCDFTADTGGGGSCGGSGADLPGNLITMNFANTDAMTVKLTIDFNPVAPGTDKLNKLYFNVDTSLLNFSDLVFSPFSGSAPIPSISSPSSNVGGGAGIFDIVFDYPQSSANKFSPGETSMVSITRTGSLNLSANAFNDTSTGELPAAVHLCITGNGNSGHYTVPEPASMLLFGTGLVGLFGYGRRKRKK